MARTYYDIRTKSNGTISVPFNTGDPNNWTRGESASFTFELPTFDGDLTVSGTYTVSGVESYGSITVESGATLTIPSGTVLQGETLTNNGTIDQDGTLTINDATTETLNKYVEWAGSWATMEMLNNVVKYRTQLPDAEPVDSLVWGIEPNSDLQGENVVGVWGLVESIDNQRNQPLTTNRYQIDVTVLAPLDEYADIDAVESDLVI